MKDRLRAVLGTLDPLRLLDEIRTVQHHLAGLAAGERVHVLPQGCRSRSLSEEGRMHGETVKSPDTSQRTHGHPVARIIPEAVALRERVDALRRAGAIAWSGRRLRPAKPIGKVRGNNSVADLVVENRE